MNKRPESAEKLLIKGISYLSRARGVAQIDKLDAMDIMYKGIKCINNAITLSPDDIDNRLMRARHLLEASIASPENFLSTVEEDFDYLDPKIDLLEVGQKILLYNIFADYYVYLGEREKGKTFYRKTIALSPDSTCATYARKLLEVI